VTASSPPSTASAEAEAAVHSAQDTLEGVLSQVSTRCLFKLSWAEQTSQQAEAALRGTLVALMVSELQCCASRLRSGQSWELADEPAPPGTESKSLEMLQPWIEGLLLRACEALDTISAHGLGTLLERTRSVVEVASMLELIALHVQLQSQHYEHT